MTPSSRQGRPGLSRRCGERMVNSLCGGLPHWNSVPSVQDAMERVDGYRKRLPAAALRSRPSATESIYMVVWCFLGDTVEMKVTDQDLVRIGVTGAEAEAIRRVLHVLQQIKPIDALDPAVVLTGRLVDIGFTSVDMVTIMLSIESEFDIVIPQREITPENFSSARALAAMLSRLAAPA